jgi:hypothetical protein
MFLECLELGYRRVFTFLGSLHEVFFVVGVCMSSGPQNLFSSPINSNQPCMKLVGNGLEICLLFRGFGEEVPVKPKSMSPLGLHSTCRR